MSTTKVNKYFVEWTYFTKPQTSTERSESVICVLEGRSGKGQSWLMSVEEAKNS